MPSQVWGRDPEEAHESPYEYALQEQFAREATVLLATLYRLLNSDCHRYRTDDRSPRKAIWLLAMDALDSLREALVALQRKEHRVAGKLFRDVVESVDLAAFFGGGSERSVTCLDNWYEDEIVPHREYRDFVRKTHGAEEAERLKKHYSSLSRFTHRSYRAILAGYSRGGENRLVHDRTAETLGLPSEHSSSMLVLPETIASYYAVLANLVLEYSSELPELELVGTDDISAAFAESLEEETEQRRSCLADGWPRGWPAVPHEASSSNAPTGVGGARARADGADRLWTGMVSCDRCSIDSARADGLAPWSLPLPLLRWGPQ